MRNYLKSKLVCEVTKDFQGNTFIHFWFLKWHLASFKVVLSDIRSFSGIIPEPFITLVK